MREKGRGTGDRPLVRSPMQPVFELLEGMSRPRAITPMPRTIEVTGSLIGRPVFQGLERRDDILDFRLENGRWIYRIVRVHPDRDLLIGELVYSEQS